MGGITINKTALKDLEESGRITKEEHMLGRLYHMVLYKALCLTTGECYIGITYDLDERKDGHFNDMRGKSNRKFMAALRKYGWNDFIWDKLYIGTLLECMRGEVFYIKVYDSKVNGFNMTDGGEAPRGISTNEWEIQRKISSYKYRDFKRDPL